MECNVYKKRIKEILPNNDEHYKLKIIIDGVEIISSLNHKFLVWNKLVKELEMKEAKELNKEIHEIVVKNY
jgi:hypothetical protein